jgi:heptosyltransferase I
MPQILIVKTSSLGDVVHNLPVVADILANVPGAAVDWVVESAFADIPRLHPGVRRVIPVGLRDWRGAWWRRTAWREIDRFMLDLKQTDYDVVLDTQGLVKSAVVGALARGRRYGQDYRSAREPLASLFYDRRFHVVRGRHAVVRNRDLAAQALGYSFPSTAPDYGLRIPKEGLPENLREPYLLCLHGSSRESKAWPRPYWMSLAKDMLDRGLIPVFPWGSDAERANARAIAESVPGAVVLPKLPLRRLAIVVSRARAVVGVDTGLVHLAAAFARPTVAIYTDTSPHLTGVAPADEKLGVNLGNAGHIPMPAEVRGALTQLGVL